MHPILSPLALGLCLCAVGVPWQLAQDSDAQLRGEIEFARALSRERGMVDLCERVLAGVERGRLSPRMREELALARAEIYFEAAHRDLSARGELLAKSMDAFRAYSRVVVGAEAKAAAEAELTAVWSYYAHDLARKLERDPGQSALERELVGVLNATVAKSAGLAAAIARKGRPERSAAEQRRWCELTLTAADMNLELGRAGGERESFLRAEQALIALSDAEGAASPWGVRALTGLGDVLSAQGRRREAAERYASAALFAIRRDVAQWSELCVDIARDERGSRLVLAEPAVAGLLRALAAEGREPEAIAWGLQLYNVSRREGLALGDDGCLALLQLARCLADAGGFVTGAAGASALSWSAASAIQLPARRALDFALELARQVTQSGAGGELGALGFELLSELIARPDAAPEANVLRAAASAEFDDGRGLDDLIALQRVACALRAADPAARAACMPQLLGKIGQGFGRRGRDLEAALCFEDALDHWRGEPALDRANAEALLGACAALAAGAQGDAVIDALAEKARRIAAEIDGDSSAQSEFEQAENAFAAGDWKRVTALLDGFDQRFPSATSLAPAALHRALVAHARLGEFEPMRALLATLATKFPSSAFTAHAALAAHDALAVLRDAATDPAAKAALAREMALALRVLGAATETPDFEALRRESKLWLACGDWAQAEQVLRRIAEQFAGDADRERVAHFVLPDLARALLAQHAPARAAEILKPLVDAGQATHESAHDYARALAGWVEAPSGGDAAELVEVPGVGGAANFEAALALYERLLASPDPRATPEGLALCFDALYARRQYARIDPGQLAAAQRSLAELRDELGPEFARADVPAELRRKLVWLAEALK